MSADLEATADMMSMSCCASCGKAEVDDVKLKKCACNLVKYCSVDCQRNHRPQHKKACKKRIAEIRDDKLFSQPDESHLGACPICCLPLPFDPEKSTIQHCCSKVICRGCWYANLLREDREGLEHKCTFCREPMADGEGNKKRMMKRVKANDPVTIREVGKKRRIGGDVEEANKYFKKAAELGDAEAHFELAMHNKGKDPKREMHHLEEAAVGGHPAARHNIGIHELRRGRIDRANKHFIIAAKLGWDGALESVKRGFMDGYVRKEDYAAALRGHQAAVDAMKSKQREEAYVARFESITLRR